MQERVHSATPRMPQRFLPQPNTNRFGSGYRPEISPEELGRWRQATTQRMLLRHFQAEPAQKLLRRMQSEIGGDPAPYGSFRLRTGKLVRLPALVRQAEALSTEDLGFLAKFQPQSPAPLEQDRALHLRARDRRLEDGNTRPQFYPALLRRSVQSLQGDLQVWEKPPPGRYSLQALMLATFFIAENIEDRFRELIRSPNMDEFRRMIFSPRGEETQTPGYPLQKNEKSVLKAMAAQSRACLGNIIDRLPQDYPDSPLESPELQCDADFVECLYADDTAAWLTLLEDALKQYLQQLIHATKRIQESREKPHEAN